MDGRPPLAVSPRRLRPRKTTHQSNIPSVQVSKSKIPTRPPAPYSPPRRSDSERITTELLAMAKQLHDDIEGGVDFSSSLAFPKTSSPLFERGRFYELYSARRNERLKRKQREYLYSEEGLAQEPEVAVELSKRRGIKKSEGVRKSVPADFSVGRQSVLRSSVRSSKEMKKASGGLGFEGSVVATAKRMGTRSSVRRL